MVSVDMSAVVELQSVPAGEYRVSLSGFKDKDTKNGDPMTVLEFTINDEDAEQFNGQKLFQNCVLTPSSFWKFKQTLVAFDIDEELLNGPEEHTDLINDVMGRTAICVVKNTGNEKYPTAVDRLKMEDFE